MLLSRYHPIVTTWPVGERAVKIVGAIGFPRVPAGAKRRAITKLTERFRRSVGGSPENAVGAVTPADDWNDLFHPPFAKRMYRSS